MSCVLFLPSSASSAFPLCVRNSVGPQLMREPYASSLRTASGKVVSFSFMERMKNTYEWVHLGHNTHTEFHQYSWHAFHSFHNWHLLKMRLRRHCPSFSNSETKDLRWYFIEFSYYDSLILQLSIPFNTALISSYSSSTSEIPYIPLKVLCKKKKKSALTHSGE